MSPELRLLLSILGAHKRRYALGCFFLACSDAGQLAVPWLIGRLVDRLASGTIDGEGVRWIALGVAGAALFTALVRYGWRIYVFGTARLVDRDLRQRLYDHLQRLSLSFHLHHKVGDLMAHATNDIQAVRAAASEGVMTSFDGIAMAAGASLMMVVGVDWRLSAAALAPLVILPYVTYRIGQLEHVRFDLVQEAFASLSARAAEAISGIRVVKGFAREDHQAAFFAESNEAYRHHYGELQRCDVAFDPVINLLAGASFSVGIAYGGWLVLRGQLTVGQYVAFNSFLSMLIWPMLALGWTTNLIQRATASVGRLQTLFDSRPDVVDAPGALALQPVAGAISLKGLRFAYGPDLPPALDGIDLEVPAGATIGVIGGTGAGKTTLANLLVRLFDPPPGQVLLDGHDVNGLTLGSLRAAIAYVPQDGFLFSRSITENVAFDPAPHPEPAVRAAARRAQLDEDVQGFPKGYDTLLGERGVTLSGGQRQRVSIARALLKDAPVLVLDDCLSAVDTLTEARLVAELKQSMAGRTTLVISNRTSALAHADLILVLAAGRVIERGTHAALVAAEGEYARIHRRQQLEAAIEGM